MKCRLMVHVFPGWRVSSSAGTRFIPRGSVNRPSGILKIFAEPLQRPSRFAPGSFKSTSEIFVCSVEAGSRGMRIDTFRPSGVSRYNTTVSPPSISPTSIMTAAEITMGVLSWSCLSLCAGLPMAGACTADDMNKLRAIATTNRLGSKAILYGSASTRNANGRQSSRCGPPGTPPGSTNCRSWRRLSPGPCRDRFGQWTSWWRHQSVGPVAGTSAILSKISPSVTGRQFQQSTPTSRLVRVAGMPPWEWP